MDNLSQYREVKEHFVKRQIWNIINRTLFRMLPTKYLSRPRIWLLRLFGADIDYSSLIYPSVLVFAPWNIKIGAYSCIAPHTELYCKAGRITIGANTVISQGSYICCASHDINSRRHSLIGKDIVIGDRVWIAADAFVGMGVTLHDGAVVGARAAVFKDVAPWTVVGGNPARQISKRQFRD